MSFEIGTREYSNLLDLDCFHFQRIIFQNSKCELLVFLLGAHKSSGIPIVKWIQVSLHKELGGWGFKNINLFSSISGRQEFVEAHTQQIPLGKSHKIKVSSWKFYGGLV
jgi:hypothetical protein